MIDFLLSKMSKNGSITPYGWITNRIYELVDKRKSENINRKDYIQLLIDAEATSNASYEDNSINLTNMNLDKKLSSSVLILCFFFRYSYDLVLI